METPETYRLQEALGLPSLGGTVALVCRWRISAALSRLAPGLPIYLGSHVRSADGNISVVSGPTSSAYAAQPTDLTIVLPVIVPTSAGEYTLILDSLIGNVAWASAFGVTPLEISVQRDTAGDLLFVQSDAGFRRTVTWPRRDGQRHFRITHPVYGLGDSERCVEIPWALSRYRGERVVVDLGYANAERRHADAVQALGVPNLIGLDIAPGAGQHLARVVGDARKPPLVEGSVDLILAISVVEHIGCDNSVYVGSQPIAPRASDGDMAAVRAMGRLLSPGGRLLLSVPYGRAEHHGWFIQYDESRLAALISASGLALEEAEYFRYSDGWRGPLSPGGLVDCRYQVGAVAASGLACLSLRRPA